MQKHAVAQLSDGDLLQAMRHTLHQQRQGVVQFLEYLVEVEARRLHVQAGHNSLYGFIRSLGFGEGEAYRRSSAAKVVRDFPAVKEYLAHGTLHLTAVSMLSKSLTAANHADLLMRAQGLSRERLEALLAPPAPRAPAAARITVVGAVTAPAGALHPPTPAAGRA